MVASRFLEPGVVRRALVMSTLTFAVTVPLFGVSNYNLSLFALALIYVLLTLGFNFTFGYTGQLSLGHIGFWAIGAYATALLTTEHGWASITAALFGMLIAAAAALMLGLLTRQLRSHYLALASLAFAAIIQIVANQYVELTGGPNGISGIPPLGLGGWEVTSPTGIYYVLLAFAVAGAAFAWKWQRSRYGRRSVALETGDLVTQSVGVEVGRLKLLTLVISAVFAAIAGSLYAHVAGFISPDAFNLHQMFVVLSMLVVGGSGTVSGAIIGSILLTMLPEWFRAFDRYWQFVYGVALLLIVLRMSYGVVGLITRLWYRLVPKRPVELLWTDAG